MNDSSAIKNYKIIKSTYKKLVIEDKSKMRKNKSVLRSLSECRNLYTNAREQLTISFLPNPPFKFVKLGIKQSSRGNSIVLTYKILNAKHNFMVCCGNLPMVCCGNLQTSTKMKMFEFEFIISIH